MIYRELNTSEYDLLKEFLYEVIYIPEGIDPHYDLRFTGDKGLKESELYKEL